MAGTSIRTAPSHAQPGAAWDPNHRHEIRSHVMRNVRQHESNQGVKRPTGRGRARRINRDRKVDKASSADAGTPTTPIHTAAQETDSQFPARPVSSESPTSRLRYGQVDPYAMPLYSSPSGDYGLDRFCDSSQNSLSETAMRGLLSYATTHFIPMTFPVENRNSNLEVANHIVVDRVLEASRPAFFAFLATTACHRAVLHRRHSELGADGPSANCDRIRDREFILAHRSAITETNDKAKGGVLDSDYLEACVSIISTLTLAGDFNVARQYLHSLLDVLQHVELSPPTAAWLPLTDAKVAVGLMSRPQVPLPWARVQIEDGSLQRMLPPADDPLLRMGSAFATVSGLSTELQRLLCDATLICLMCDFNARDVVGLRPHEHISFRCKSMELEHDLLSYVFDIFPVSAERADGLEPTPDVPLTEDVVRLAVLGLMTMISVHVLPGSGLGRAMTRQQMRAMTRWFASNLNGQQSLGEKMTGNTSDTAALHTILWALFVFAKCAREQPEEEALRKMLAEVMTRLQMSDWDDIEHILYGFLYVPTMLRPPWWRTWELVEGIICAANGEQQPY
ncbi:hypothetical protein DV735_g264, partial [Chaetothyriales sp. CBS 134920]